MVFKDRNAGRQDRSPRKYHLMELLIARTPDDPRHVMPDVQDRHRRILDVGCGAGQILIASHLNPDILAVGVDMDLKALVFGAELTKSVRFVGGAAENLPFADRAFDLVIARVVLPLTFIPAAMMEIGRVLRPGGEAWLVLHSFSATLRHLVKSLLNLRLKQVFYRSYVLINGLIFHLSGRMFPIFPGGHFETFQTDRMIRRELQAARFGNIRISRGRQFVVTAEKREQD